jgi:hypothetical protein
MTAMEINGLELPSRFVQDLRSGRLRRERGSWPLREEKSAYGEPLETELGYVFPDVAAIQKETDQLPDGYVCISVEEVDEYTRMFGTQPGEIPYFWDFSEIVCFAIAGDGAPFCFDFRENQQEPSVIWWADAYWQRVARDYESFIRLFDVPPRGRNGG